jgi:hypothetical protein
MADSHNVSTESVVTLIFLKVSGRVDDRKKFANSKNFEGIPDEGIS